MECPKTNGNVSVIIDIKNQIREKNLNNFEKIRNPKIYKLMKTWCEF